MFCGAFAGTKESQLFFFGEYVIVDRYIQMLRDTLLIFTEELPIGWIFMHDGAPIRCCMIVQNWFREVSIRLLDWTAYSHDLNPIENVWVILNRFFYGNQLQFDNEDSLKELLLRCGGK